MTEEEWQVSNRPVDLLDFVLNTLSVRRQRLVAIAVCRTIPSRVLGEDGERWLATADRLAEKPHVRITATSVRKWLRDFELGRELSLGHPNLTAVFFQVGLGDARTTMVNVGYVRGTTGQNYDLVDETIANAVRDIFGNPFRPVTLLPEWRTSTVLALATGI